MNLQVDEREAVRLPVCLRFDIDGPAAIRNQITRVLAPHAIDIDRVIEHPERVLVGKTFEKKVEVSCDHCGRPQEVSIPFQIERVEGDRGYGPGGSINVTCYNSGCNKPFEVTWDNVIVELVFRP